MGGLDSAWNRHVNVTVRNTNQSVSLSTFSSFTCAVLWNVSKLPGMFLIYWLTRPRLFNTFINISPCNTRKILPFSGSLRTLPPFLFVGSRSFYVWCNHLVDSVRAGQGHLTREVTVYFRRFFCVSEMEKHKKWIIHPKVRLSLGYLYSSAIFLDFTICFEAVRFKSDVVFYSSSFHLFFVVSSTLNIVNKYFFISWKYPWTYHYLLIIIIPMINHVYWTDGSHGNCHLPKYDSFVLHQKLPSLLNVIPLSWIEIVQRIIK